MSIISVPNVFSAGAVIVASQHNSNFSAIYNDYSGNIDNTNIVAAAGIVASKLDLTSPGAVGSTAANTGKFTTLEATSTLKLATTHQGDILYDNGTSLVRLTPGTSGQFLQTKGASANPAWASNTFSLVSSTSVSATTSSGNITITATGVYKLFVNGVDSGSAGTLSIIINGDTGNNYNSGYVGRGSSAAIGASSANGASIITSAGFNAGSFFNAEIFLGPTTNPNTENVYGALVGNLGTAGYGISNFGGQYSGASAITSFAVKSNQNWTGTVYLYQIALS